MPSKDLMPSTARLDECIRRHVVGACPSIDKRDNCLCPLCDLKRLQNVCEAARSLLKQTSEDDKLMGVGDRTQEENDALEELTYALLLATIE